jgi:3-hydroxyisobutyrate dehydrogenase-like beta-hydroxyacid dehydrogenase
MATKTTVAAIGLGKIGSAIARQLCEADLDVRVFNRTRAKAEPFAALGATVAASPAEAVDGATVVITNLLGDASVQEMLLDQGLLAAMAPGSVHVSTSTVSPRSATEVAALHAEAGSRFVAGPVVGRPEQAEQGQLTTLLGGASEAIELARPVISVYAARLVEVGPDPAVANSLKLGINYWAISMIELFGQLYAYAEKSGIGVELMRDTVKSLLHHPAFQSYADSIAARTYSPAGFALPAGFKDVHLMLEVSTSTRTPLKYGNVVRDKLLTALGRRDMDDLDWSAIYEITRAEAGLEA